MLKMDKWSLALIFFFLNIVLLVSEASPVAEADPDPLNINIQVSQQVGDSGDLCSSLSPPGFWIPVFDGAPTCAERGGIPTGITRPGGQCCQPTFIPVEPVCGVGLYSNATCIHGNEVCLTGTPKASCVHEPEPYYCCDGNECKTPTCTYIAWPGKPAETGYCNTGPIKGYNNVGQQDCDEGCKCWVHYRRMCGYNRNSPLTPYGGK